MWMVDPKLMCRSHLLGEHNELHMLVGHINKGRRLGRYLTDGLVEPQNIEARHAELVAEMTSRGYNHASALPSLAFPAEDGHINRAANLKELKRRCPACGRFKSKK
jgi:hypothetical protein